MLDSWHMCSSVRQSIDTPQSSLRSGVLALLLLRR